VKTGNTKASLLVNERVEMDMVGMPYRVLALGLYHSLGKLPEPESTHDFF
jgi:hypothetical protein